ncbi:IS5/IS1182 family transposase [Rubrivivax gelatinosus]|uniref:IS5 family transposase n=1 Tax=Rubrivivax gelatinosus TaxID=28068 RepID=UPI001906E7E1|nr:IS5 family transposase [Rubrivivax gelatinosus]MBK1613822.1 IS5/IS1182 family transposase [Rubrivivax gelatinosus]
MRGADSYNESLFSTVRLEDFVPAKHPLRVIRTWVNDALAKMDGKFSAMYEADIKGGRPSIAPEKLMRAMLLQVLYSVRSERQLVEQIQYNLLFRWFVGLAIEDAVWHHSVFSKNRDRLIEHDAVTDLFNETVEMAHKRDLLSGEHFSVDGTLIQAWASHKSVRRKDGSDDDRPPEDWRGEPRSNDTHASKSDPEAKLYRKSDAAPALPSYLGHVMTDNRHGLVVDVQASHSDGRAEREVAAQMAGDAARAAGRRITVGADKAYDTRGFVKACRENDVTPHVAQNLGRRGGSAIDGRTTRHGGYAVSQRRRKCIEQCFGWGKVVGPMRQVMLRGLDKVDQLLTLTMAAYNLTRLRGLAQLRPQCA